MKKFNFKTLFLIIAIFFTVEAIGAVRVNNPTSLGVKKTGDTMTGTLIAPSFNFTNNLISTYGGNSSSWNIMQRSIISGLAVPTFRPLTTTSSIALDIMPNGSPSDGGYGTCWFDICLEDAQNSGVSALHSLHFAPHPGWNEISSVVYQGAATIPSLMFGAVNATGSYVFNNYFGITNLQFEVLKSALFWDRITATNGIASLTNNLVAPATITIGASPTLWTNTTPVNAVVYVDGISVTGTVSLNGGVIFNSIGQNTVILQPNEIVTITYTIGTPTAKWKSL